MTAPTPEQMRAIADDLGTIELDAQDALRTAADQLEAVQALAERWKREGVLSAYTTELSNALVADTAPQESGATYSGSLREALFECAAVFPGDLLGPVMHCRKRKEHTGEHNADGMRWIR